MVTLVGIDKRAIHDYLHDLKVLTSVDVKLTPMVISEVSEKLRTSNAKKYLELLPHSKPEVLLSEFLFKPILDIAGAEWGPEIRLDDRGWVDYVFKKGATNPVAVELKAMHKVSGKRVRMEEIYRKLREEFELTKENQIVKYLRSGVVDYVVLTNLEEVYYFNREAVIDFEPFHRESFEEFIADLINIEDLWEVARRKEDKVPKQNLDKEFFEDLRGWHRALLKLKWKTENPSEAIVHLINKFIFIRTLEDYGLIPFRFVRDAYEEAERKWSPKGPIKVLEVFFDDVDEWFYLYYDTELFQKSVFDYLEGDEESIKSFDKRLKLILGLKGWGGMFQRGLLYYNFRQIDEDIFGKAYETFLAERRKQQGIYYTPKEITKYMAKRLVEELFSSVKGELLEVLGSADFDENRAWELAKRLTEIAVIDPACGSGSFLIKVLREIYRVYDEIEEKTRWATDMSNILSEPDDIKKRKEAIRKIRDFLGFDRNEHRRKLISLIILRHIYGVDLDERAIDVAKVNLWKEAVRLYPVDFRYTNLKESGHILPDLEMNLVNGNSIVSLPDDEVVELMSEFKDEIKALWEKRKEYLGNPLNPEVLEGIEDIKTRIRERLVEAMKERGWDFEKPLFYPLEFFFLYFDENGNPLPKEERGFHGVIGNPPWENIKPQSKEFAAMHPEIFGEVSKFSIEGPKFKRLFKEKLKDPNVKRLWEEYEESIKKLSEFIRSRYRLYGKGDLSYQKVFIERAMELSKGAVNLLIPSNFHTDEGAMPLRKEIFDKYCLRELVSFENRGNGWFKDVDSRFKFDIVFFTKERCDKPFGAAFYVTRKDYEEWVETNGGTFEDFINETAFEYPLELIPKLSPGVLGVTEFRRKEDFRLVQKIRGDWKLLREHGWDIKSEFHMTNDNDLFNTSRKGLILYEGKMIHQYEPFFSEPRYWVEEEKGRERLLSKELSRVKKFLKAEGGRLGLKGRELREFINENYGVAKEGFENGNFKLDYEEHRLAYRAIASSTNERTLISTVLPKKVFTGNSLNYFKPFRYAIRDGKIVQERIPYEDVVYLMALLNSFTLDYYIRQRVSANLNMFYIYELPIPEVEPGLKKRIGETAFKLLYRKGHYDDMARELGISSKEITDEDKRRELRAELEAAIARDAFGLSRDEMNYILSTFVYGNPDRELMKTILEAMDE
ncbi:Eco57I restriction-modification methylase domain-containing protein [Thermococcus sp. Bubb.Bath]|uniref:Eco57I restriction-modification methylase domain-containing protein n=1 Tax=Thermococcus sp. Bubb.Bath TaxID=1638242 RepID=UPI00143C231B|nr:hypothetical protein [Thermococcus sp. Bubb.Bath]